MIIAGRALKLLTIVYFVGLLLPDIASARLHLEDTTVQNHTQQSAQIAQVYRSLQSVAPKDFGLVSDRSLYGHTCSANDSAYSCTVCNCVFEVSRRSANQLEREAVVTTVFNRMDIPMYPKTACGNVWLTGRGGTRAYSWTNPKVWRKMGYKYNPVMGRTQKHRQHVRQCASATRNIALAYYSHHALACFTNYYSPSGMRAYRRKGVAIKSLIPEFAQGQRYIQHGSHRFTCNHGSSDSIAGNSEVRELRFQLTQRTEVSK